MRLLHQIRKFKRPSITAVAMACMITGASILLLVLGSVRTVSDVKTKQHMTWNPVCA